MFPQFCNRNLFIGHDIRAQVRLAWLILLIHDDHFPDMRMCQKLRFDLPALDPVAPDLHLMIDPAQVLQIAVRQPSR
ncbi:hypothetical protein ABGV43_30945 [Paenibacillus amylolyticus]